MTSILPLPCSVSTPRSLYLDRGCYFPFISTTPHQLLWITRRERYWNAFGAKDPQHRARCTSLPLFCGGLPPLSGTFYHCLLSREIAHNAGGWSQETMQTPDLETGRPWVTLWAPFFTVPVQMFRLPSNEGGGADIAVQNGLKIRGSWCTREFVRYM